MALALRAWHTQTRAAVATRSAAARALPASSRDLLSLLLVKWWLRSCGESRPRAPAAAADLQSPANGVLGLRELLDSGAELVGPARWLAGAVLRGWAEVSALSRGLRDVANAAAVMKRLGLAGEAFREWRRATEVAAHMRDVAATTGLAVSARRERGLLSQVRGATSWVGGPCGGQGHARLGTALVSPQTAYTLLLAAAGTAWLARSRTPGRAAASHRHSAGRAHGPGLASGRPGHMAGRGRAAAIAATALRPAAWVRPNRLE